jgi:hypothetical protein
VLNPQEGTIEGWFYITDYFRTSTTDARRLFRCYTGTDGNPGGLALWGSGDTLVATMNSSRVAIPRTNLTTGWHYIGMRWTSERLSLLVDGQEVAYVISPQLSPYFADIASIGTSIDHTGQNFNSLIDDLRISNRARTDEEIAAAYASGQPLPVDEWTTLKQSFDDTLSGITTAGDSIITHSTWRYRGPHNIKAVGKSALVRGVQAQQTKSVSAVKTVAETAREIAQAANQSTQLIQDAITGYVLIRKNENTGSNEILIMDNPDPAQARKVWRWNMGGLGYSDNVVGADNPAREYTVAMTMDGAINANFIKTGKLSASVVQIGPETTYEAEEVYTWQKYAGMTWQEIIDSLEG